MPHPSHDTPHPANSKDRQEKGKGVDPGDFPSQAEGEEETVDTALREHEQKEKAEKP